MADLNNDVDLGNEAGKKKMGGVFSDPKTRMVMLLFIVAAFAVMAISYFGGRKQVQEGPSRTVSVPVAGDDGKTPASPEYRRLLDEQNRQRAEEALQDPTKSAMPKLVGLTDPQKRHIDPDQESPSNLRTPPAPVTYVQPAMPQPAAAPQMDQAAYQRASQMFAAIVEGNDPSKRKHSLLFMDQQQAQQAQTAANSGNSNSASTSTPAVQRVALIRAGTLVYATTDLAVNSDQSGPVVATIQEGPLKGAKAIGDKTLENDAVVLRFTSFTIPGIATTATGTAYAVKVDDPDVRKYGSTGFADNVDYHIWERYVLPSAAAFVKGLGDAALRSSTSVTVQSGGITTAASPLDAKQQLLTAAGSAGSSLGGDLSRNASRPVTVQVNPSRDIGIMFTADLFAPQTGGQPPPAPTQQAPQRPTTGALDQQQAATNATQAAQAAVNAAQATQAVSGAQAIQTYQAVASQPYGAPLGVPAGNYSVLNSYMPAGSGVR
jgi:intracellular multiplication protein IcmE